MSYLLHGKQDFRLNLPISGQQWVVVLLLLEEKNTVRDFVFVRWNLTMESSSRASLAAPGARQLPKSSP